MSNRKDTAKTNLEAEKEKEDTETDINVEKIEKGADEKVAEASVGPEEQKTPETPKASETKAMSKAPSDIVLIGLKHPQGISFPMSGGRMVTVAGNAAHLAGLGKGILPKGGFGLTSVSTEDWEYITKTYGKMAIFKSGLIFAADNNPDASAISKERDSVKSGFEPVSVGKESTVGALKNVTKAAKE